MVHTVIEIHNWHAHLSSCTTSVSFTCYLLALRTSHTMPCSDCSSIMAICCFFLSMCCKYSSYRNPLTSQPAKQDMKSVCLTVSLWLNLTMLVAIIFEEMVPNVISTTHMHCVEGRNELARVAANFLVLVSIYAIVHRELHTSSGPSRKRAPRSLAMRILESILSQLPSPAKQGT
jgi:hypothetical protein